MSEANRCPYCLQRLQQPDEARVVRSGEALAGFIGVEEDAPVHEDCYLNAADRV